MIKSKEIIPDAVLEFMKNCAVEKIALQDNSDINRKRILLTQIDNLYYSVEHTENVIKMYEKKLKAFKFTRKERFLLDVKTAFNTLDELKKKIAQNANNKGKQP